VPPDLTADQSGHGNLSMGIAMLSLPFCILFAGCPWVTIMVASPSPELAAITGDQLVVQRLNPGLEQVKYPPNICSWRAGACGVAA
jgi:hypothetical protein